MSTIYALSTVAGKSAVAIVRVSGPKSRSILAKLGGGSIVPRRASLKTLRHPQTLDLLDKALTLFFEAPRTFTGEDTCEFHLHGSRSVIKSVLAAIPACGSSIRYAEPGEFSKRAFYNDKMDLTQAEGLADLINAETDEQRRSAHRQADGALSRLYEGWRRDLIELRSLLEAVIDFGEDNDGIEESSVNEVITKSLVMQSQLQRHLASSIKGELLRNGVQVTIFGPPNAGKSSLLNLLAQRDASIVSSEAGTTRDVIETILDIGGFPVILGDTAGLREGQSVGEIEIEGVKRARRKVHDANLRICMISKGSLLDETTLSELRICREREENMQSTILLLNKSDQIDVDNKLTRREINEQTGISEDNIFEISCITKDGVDQFLSCLIHRLRQLTLDGVDESGDSRDSRLSLGTNARHRDQVEQCLSHIGAFLGKWTVVPSRRDQSFSFTDVEW